MVEGTQGALLATDTHRIVEGTQSTVLVADAHRIVDRSQSSPLVPDAHGIAGGNQGAPLVAYTHGTVEGTRGAPPVADARGDGIVDGIQGAPLVDGRGRPRPRTTLAEPNVPVVPFRNVRKAAEAWKLGCLRCFLVDKAKALPTSQGPRSGGGASSWSPGAIDGTLPACNPRR